VSIIGPSSTACDPACCCAQGSHTPRPRGHPPGPSRRPSPGFVHVVRRARAVARTDGRDPKPSPNCLRSCAVGFWRNRDGHRRDAVMVPLRKRAGSSDQWPCAEPVADPWRCRQCRACEARTIRIRATWCTTVDVVVVSICRPLAFRVTHCCSQGSGGDGSTRSSVFQLRATATYRRAGLDPGHARMSPKTKWPQGLRRERNIHPSRFRLRLRTKVKSIETGETRFPLHAVPTSS